jgi:lipopolysaccharide/colanic/teichoic acid biosynthesis glycosyltransferase
MTLKRCFDVTFSSVALLFLLPFLGIIALLVRLSSPGPVTFRQKRVGFHGVPFTMFKFRSMQDGSGRPNDYISPGDTRVTSVGKFLRKTHLDELPQLLNVIRGEMSLVGPRPSPLDWVSRWEKRPSALHLRLSVLPGITGLSQIHWRQITPRRQARREILVDGLYLRHHCFLLDIKILAKTIPVMLRGSGV